eukprot:7154281-Lingulodinium_polyedra.AAC.1
MVAVVMLMVMLMVMLTVMLMAVMFFPSRGSSPQCTAGHGGLDVKVDGGLDVKIDGGHGKSGSG